MIRFLLPMLLLAANCHSISALWIEKLGFQFTDGRNLSLSALEYRTDVCSDHADCEVNEVCDFRNQKCVCKQYHEWDQFGNCQPCPTEAQACASCCFESLLVCYGGNCQRCLQNDQGECITQTEIFFVTASQVALAAALIMALFAISALIYRGCTRPNYFFTHYSRQRRPRNTTPEQQSSRDPVTFQRSLFSRASLSSIQRRVLSRLRDSPPQYTADDTAQPSTPDPPQQSLPSAPSFVDIPPPLYDGQPNEEIDTRPPPYQEPHPEDDESFTTVSVISQAEETTEEKKSKPIDDERVSK